MDAMLAKITEPPSAIDGAAETPVTDSSLDPRLARWLIDEEPLGPLSRLIWNACAVLINDGPHQDSGLEQVLRYALARCFVGADRARLAEQVRMKLGGVRHRVQLPPAPFDPEDCLLLLLNACGDVAGWERHERHFPLRAPEQPDPAPYWKADAAALLLLALEWNAARTAAQPPDAGRVIDPPNPSTSARDADSSIAEVAQ